MTTADLARRQRMRYFIVGAAFALLWVGHASEPAWAHALRLGLVLVTVRPLVMLTRRYYARHWSSEASQARAIAIVVAVRVLALAAALEAGTLIERAVAHHSYSVGWLTGQRFVLLLATIPVQLRFMRSRAGAAGLGRARWNWLLAAKAGLVLAALGVQVALDGVIGKRADFVVAAGLLVTVTFLGPRLHRHLFGARRLPAAAPSSGTDRDHDVTAASA